MMPAHGIDRLLINAGRKANEPEPGARAHADDFR